jgi:hypothetical protein
MSDMRQFSMWWVFLFVFALFIGGIQSLGWWTRTASAQSSATQTKTTARCHVCDVMHWRSLVMHQ